MKRRDVLKFLSLSAAGILTGTLIPFLPRKNSATFVLLTDQPSSDVLKLLKQIGKHTNFAISEHPINPVKQDLTILMNQTLVDPQSATLPDWLRNFALQLRKRQSPARFMVTLEPRGALQEEKIVIQSNGQIFDVLTVHESFKDIRIPGPLGETHLSIENGVAKIHRASCKHQLCRKQGAVNGGKLICAPNRLVISLPGYSGIDALIG